MGASAGDMAAPPFGSLTGADVTFASLAAVDRARALRTARGISVTDGATAAFAAGDGERSARVTGVSVTGAGVAGFGIGREGATSPTGATATSGSAFVSIAGADTG